MNKQNHNDRSRLINSLLNVPAIAELEQLQYLVDPLSLENRAALGAQILEQQMQLIKENAECSAFFACLKQALNESRTRRYRKFLHKIAAHIKRIIELDPDVEQQEDCAEIMHLIELANSNHGDLRELATQIYWRYRTVTDRGQRPLLQAGLKFRRAQKSGGAARKGLKKAADGELIEWTAELENDLQKQVLSKKALGLSRNAISQQLALHYSVSVRTMNSRVSKIWHNS